jgi:pyruvate dehydrogenase E2 component (dihydrolipoamide acetyltransferase)
LAREIIMPRLSDSMEEGTILKWLVAEGDAVRTGQPLVEVETDKAVVTHEADADGTVLALVVGEGASVPVGSPIAVFGEAGEALTRRGSPEALAAAVALPAAPPASSATSATSATSAREQPPPASSGGRAKASPLARRLAAELNVDLAALSGSGPHGRVIRLDVERAAGAGAGAAGDSNGHGVAGTAAPMPSSGSPPPGADEPGSARGETTRRQLTRIQQTVVRRMSESRATVPDMELRTEVDMSSAVALREQLRGAAGDALPSFNDLIVKAAALALREFPKVNGAYRDSQFETYSRVNIGIAVAGDDALVVPTVFDADSKSLGAIARETRRLAARVRDGSIAPPELAGATFSISNLGMYGIDSFSAVINPPQAAILAVGSVRRRPVVDEDDGEIVARETVQLTLACDHRILYGVDGARFMARLRELLENPLSLLL